MLKFGLYIPPFYTTFRKHWSEQKCEVQKWEERKISVCSKTLRVPEQKCWFIVGCESFCCRGFCKQWLFFMSLFLSFCVFFFHLILFFSLSLRSVSLLLLLILMLLFYSNGKHRIEVQYHWEQPMLILSFVIGCLLKKWLWPFLPKTIRPWAICTANVTPP